MNETNQQKRPFKSHKRHGQIATVVFNSDERDLFVNEGDQIKYLKSDEAGSARFSVIKKDRTVYLIPETSVAYVRLEPQSEEGVAEEEPADAE